MAEKATKSVVFEYELEHQLKIEVRGGVITFDESQQEIYLTKMTVKPAVEITRVEILASYPNGTEKTIAEAVGKILNVGAKAAPTKETVRTTKTMRTFNDIMGKGPEPKAEPKKPEEGKSEAIKESAIPDMSVQVITDMLNIPSQVNVEGDNFKVVTKSENMTQFVTFRQSKKIKVFINGKEFAPMDEIEFIKRVFPQIDMTVFIK